jgi:hypothetical protein
MVDPEKWAEKMDSELRERDEDDARQGQIFIEKRKLLESQTPLLWKQLTHSLGEFARAFNRRRNILRIEDEGQTFCVRRSDDVGASLLTATFFRLENRITLIVQPGNWSRIYVAKVIPGNGEEIVWLIWEHADTGRKSQNSIEEIATGAMEELLRSRP